MSALVCSGVANDICRAPGAPLPAGSVDHARGVFGDLVGASVPMRKVLAMLRDVAPTDLSVLVTGETGTGKELAAKAIHGASPRAKGPFIVVDCSAIPATLAESYLFGHERGSFTGAVGRSTGAFHEADGGTLFLDEIGELSLDLQPKLLRALAERKVKRVGATHYEPVNVRVVAATLQNLSRRTVSGRFRSDLFFRVAQVRLELPPLRERREDLALLVDAICVRMGKSDRAPEIHRLLGARLAGHAWPGNVRELVNVVVAVATLPSGATLLHHVLPEMSPAGSAPSITPFAAAKRDAIAAFEAAYFAGLAAAAGANVSEMSRRSGLERHHVRAFLRKYGLSGPAAEPAAE